MAGEGPAVGDWQVRDFGVSDWQGGDLLVRDVPVGICRWMACRWMALLRGAVPRNKGTVEVTVIDWQVSERMVGDLRVDDL